MEETCLKRQGGVKVIYFNIKVCFYSLVTETPEPIVALKG